MTDPTYTDITIVADRSGSMNGPADPPYTKAERSTDGVAKLVREQKALPGKVKFSLVEFDTVYDWVATAQDTLDWTCVPRGMTALLDATGKAITETGKRLEAMPESERPGRVMFVIATDGEENSSLEFSLDTIRTMVTEQEQKYGWDFMFIGADIDAFGDGAAMGYDPGKTIPVAAVSYAAGWDVTSAAVSSARSSGDRVKYTDEHRQKIRDAESK